MDAMRRVRKIAAIAGIAVVGLLVLMTLVLTLSWPRSALTAVGLRFFLQQRNLHVAHASVHVGRGSADISDLDVKDGSGNDFFLAKRIHVVFDTRGLMGRGDRRFGLHSILIERPVLRLVHLADGTWNAAALSGGAAPAPAQPGQPVQAPSVTAPYKFSVRILSGEIQVIDPQAPVR